MTAVEWLEEQLTYQYEGQTLNKFYDWKDITEIYNQAKEMEKQQILDAFDEGSSDGYDGWGSTNKEKYYNETYGK